MSAIDDRFELYEKWLKNARERSDAAEARAAQLEAERDELKRQLEQAVAAEREACAKVAESARMIHGINSMEISCSRETARAISAAIRARSNDLHYRAVCA